MDNLKTLWVGLPLIRKMIVSFAVIATFALVSLLALQAKETNFSLLYANLEDASAGEVIANLDQMGAPYEVRGRSIYVATTQRDSLRMQLASDGLPNSGPQGYELLDGLSGFGTTSQMFDAAYWRAKEGELSRTILAIPQVKAVRVHSSSTTQRGFSRGTEMSASVTLTTRGPKISTDQARAIRHLVSSAFANLPIENVSIIDTVHGLVRDDDQMDGNLAQKLKNSAERLLEAHVGSGNVIVEVSTDFITEAETISERIIDPNSRVVISTQEEEQSSKTSDAANGAVTVASNLPAGDGANAEGASSSEDAQNRKVVNYEISETQREVLRKPGALKRITIAVLINETETPRTAEELDSLKELVSLAVGINPERGDLISIKAMPFSGVPVASEPLTASATSWDILSFVQVGALAVVTLILGLFVVRPVLLSGQKPPLLPEPIPIGNIPSVPDATTEIVEPVDRLQSLISERKTDAVKLLQSWTQTPSENGPAQ